MTIVLATIFPTVLLLASAAVAQVETPSVATSIAISPSPTTEEIFTIQTSVPSASDPWACFVDCLQPPCPTPASCLTASPTSIPPVPDTIVSVVTDSSLSTVTGMMSIPPLESPISTGVETSVITTPIFASLSSRPNLSNSAVSSSSNPPTTATTSGPVQQSTNAAAAMPKGEAVPFIVVIAGTLVFLYGNVASIWG